MLGIIISIVVCLVALALLFLIFHKKTPSIRAALPVTVDLSRPKAGFTDPLKQLFGGPSREIRELIPQLEETLLAADVGIACTSFLVEALLGNSTIKTAEQALAFLKAKMVEVLTPADGLKRTSVRPSLIFFVGVNGVGKTTTMGKLATLWQSQGIKTLMVAGDTFRAAAMEQLKVWAERSGADFVGGQSQADPTSVLFDGIRAAYARDVDLVLVDTAGRLQNKTSLMEELKKMVRVATRELKRDPDEIFLVLDATTGQNGLNQARVFAEAVPLTGLILTKYDGTSKGGIVLSIVRETGLPLRFIGMGEKPQDLSAFSPQAFVDSLFG